MPDYKSMYYHLAGRMEAIIDTMDTTVKMLESSSVALRELTEKIKATQPTINEIIIDEDSDK